MRKLFKRFIKNHNEYIEIKIRDYCSDKKVLIIFPHNVILRKNGVQQRFYSLIRYLNSRGFSVDLFSHTNYVDKWENIGDYNKEGIVRKIFLYDFNKIRGIIRNRDLPDFGNSTLRKVIQEIVMKENYGYVIVSYVMWANLVSDINENVKKVLMVEDFISVNHYLRYKGNYNLGRSIEDEIKRMLLFDVAIFISKSEYEFFKNVLRNVKCYWVPHFLMIDEKDIFPNINYRIKKNDLIFVGSDNPFNNEGIIWFLNSIYMKLSKDYSLIVVGGVNKYLNEYRNRYNNKNVSFIEYINDLYSLYLKSKVAICPMLSGTGLKVKIIEYLFFGLPVVSTPIGFSGMPGDYNSGCILTQDENEFKDALEHLLNNEKLYEEYSRKAREYYM